ncbi:tripartite motif-containing protein 2-like [Branchiostoma lanceolatum]|uniref:tripartite motif-containing protein 2-like n=1 Tax=Branchiostoma lanceolatum TaxID=7740 RepID=UPI00345687EF
MASDVIREITEEILVCRVCLDDLKQPKILPCLHTFCQPCLERLLATEPVGRLCCPKCRQHVPLPENGVLGLMYNFHVDKLCDILQQQTKEKGKMSEPHVEGRPCTACDRGKSAEFYCVECTDNLCYVCNDTQRGLKATRSHKPVTIQNLQSGQFSPLRNTLSPVPTSTSIRTCSGSPKLLKTVGKQGSGDRQFNYPTSLAVNADGDIVVTDYNNRRLQFLDKNGSFKKKINLKFTPECVVVLTDGTLLVTGDGHMIHVLDKQGRETRVFQVTGVAAKCENTKGIAVDGLGRIIVTIGHQVFVLSPSGDVILKFGDKGQGQQQFDSFLCVAVNSGNQIIISDCSNGNLKIFDPAGSHLFTCGSLGRGPGQLYRPYCVITDSEDNIIVADCFNQIVSLFSRDGTFIRHFLTREEHGLNSPTGLTLTGDLHLVVSENQAIKMFHI